MISLSIFFNPDVSNKIWYQTICEEYFVPWTKKSRLLVIVNVFLSFRAAWLAGWPLWRGRWSLCCPPTPRTPRWGCWASTRPGTAISLSCAKTFLSPAMWTSVAMSWGESCPLVLHWLQGYAVQGSVQEERGRERYPSHRHARRPGQCKV